MVQIELFNHLLRIAIISYLKSYSNVQIVYIALEYFINSNSNVCKQLINIG